jgi:putative transposase
MPVHRKKNTTPHTPGSTQEQTVPPLLDPQTFQQYLRELPRGAIREVLEKVTREELDALIGVGWGESSPKRKGYRNGYYTRDLVTTTGRVEDVQVPRDREDQFHTQVFERYRRYEPQVAQGLREWLEVASAISRLNRDLEQQFTAWRERRLQEHWRILYLDGIHFSVRHGDQTDATMILVALGVDLAGSYTC